MKKDRSGGSPVHRTIGGKKYFALAWYPKKKDAIDRANKLREKRMSARIVKGAPWGYPKTTAYMVYVPDHSRR